MLVDMPGNEFYFDNLRHNFAFLTSYTKHVKFVTVYSFILHYVSPLSIMLVL